MKLGTEGIFLMIGLALLVLVTTVAATSTSTPQDPGPGPQRAPEPVKQTWVQGTPRSVRIVPGEWPILD